MKHKSQENIILKPTFIFSYAGILGYIIFFLLRPSIDFNSGASIQLTNSEVLEYIHVFNETLGFDSTEMPSMAVRFSDRSLFSQINEEQTATITPHSLNRSGFPLNGWRITIGKKYEETAFIVGDTKIYADVGVAQIRMSDDNRISTLKTKPGQSPYFVEAETTYQELAHTISVSFGYSLNNYSWDNSEAQVDTIQAESGSEVVLSDFEIPADGTIRFKKINQQLAGPASIELSYSSITRMDSDEEIAGISIDEFIAHYLQDTDAKPVQGTNPNAILDALFLIGFVILMIIIVLITGLRQVFRGRVEWKRSIVILVLVTLAQSAWNVLYYRETFYLFIDSSIAYVDLLQQVFVALIYGLYAALAYISWESLARDLRSQQIPVIDAFWSGKFFQKQLGAGILAGYGIAGFYLGILAVYMFSVNGVYTSIDSMIIGVRDIGASVPSMFFTINAGLTSTMIVLAQVGIMYCLFAYLFTNDVFRIIATTVFCGLSMYGLNQFFVTDVSNLQTGLLYILLAIPLVFAYRYFGLISAFFSLFILFIIVRATPLLQSSNTEFVANLWILGLILFIPFAIGLVGLRGASIKSYKEYAPEYEAIKNKQLRSEKELAIAKESQYALMPTKAPEVSGLDIRGFFVPSYEVGGDFYDYEVINDRDGNPEAVALAIVDVSGKAMKSAFNAIFTSGLLLSRIYTDRPEVILTEVNPILCKKTDVKTFVTCQIGRITLSDKKLSLSNAGHCLPLLKRDQKTTFIQTKGPRFPLGMQPKIAYESTQVDLKSGDVLLLYSDGLAEAVNKKGDRLSFADIQVMLNGMKTADMNAEEICATIKKFILEYSDYELVDDTTVICVKVL